MVFACGFPVTLADNFLWLEVCYPRRSVTADIISASSIGAHPHHQQFG
jgi:hypothetical protein